MNIINQFITINKLMKYYIDSSGNQYIYCLNKLKISHSDSIVCTNIINTIITIQGSKVINIRYILYNLNKLKISYYKYDSITYTYKCHKYDHNWKGMKYCHSSQNVIKIYIVKSHLLKEQELHFLTISFGYSNVL